MDYEKAQPFHGDPQKAMDLAIHVFAQNGFRIVSSTSSTL